jgi:hypothetical protein
MSRDVMNRTLPIAAMLALSATTLPSLDAISESGTTVTGGGEAAPSGSLPALAWSDFDGDGLDDVLAIHGGVCSLFRATESGGLVDCTALSGLSTLPTIGAAAWTDYDGDGAPDLFLVTASGEGRLLHNEEGKTFLDATTRAGLAESGSILRAEWGDVDDDANLDLVLWTAERVLVHRNRGDGTFSTSELSLGASSVGAGPRESQERTAGSAAFDGAVGGASPSTRPSLPGGVQMGAMSTSTALLPAPPGVTTAGGVSQLAFCPTGLYDYNLGGCLYASAVPTMGLLFPVTVALNVESATGRVGVNTTTPAAQLHVDATGNTAFRSSSTDRAAVLTNSSVNLPALEVQSGGYAGWFDGRVEVGYTASNPPFFFPVPRLVMGTSNNAATFDMFAADGSNAVRLQAQEFVGGGAQLELFDFDELQTITLDADTSNGALLSMRHENAAQTVELLSAESATNGAQLSLGAATGVMTFVVDAQAGSTAANLQMYSMAGQSTIEMQAEEVSGDGAQIILRKADGTASIVLDAEQGTDGRITTETLEITGGADLVESFETGGSEYAPGTVLVIDPEHPGELTTSATAYDRRVAGVVSGAGDVRPGLHLGQAGVTSGSTPVALTGRVYVSCSAENGPIQPGDLLTTSSNPGRAMRATDAERSNGAVLGKAMTALEGDGGLVLVLVNLQ